MPCPSVASPGASDRHSAREDPPAEGREVRLRHLLPPAGLPAAAAHVGGVQMGGVGGSTVIVDKHRLCNVVIKVK